MLLILFTGACQRFEQDPVSIVNATDTAQATAVPTDTPTKTPPNTPTNTPSPTITPTPLPTATPTATAVPITISSSPRTAVIGTPAANGNAPCGVVDLLDFPLDPPHGENARGGGDFGIWRNRYDKYHAGEDWRLAAGNNLGEPVYSIGHGLVTYADPNGWGRDKGVVIIRHTFADGETILSFYGHLDPPSILTKPGLCVTRGEQIGAIGKPRSSPHLHFEIRSHLPYQTGRGYWAEDPRLEGWLPPSQTIWHSRLEAAPGVVWSRMAENGGINILGITTDQTLIVLEDGWVQGIDISDGALKWEFQLPDESETAVLDLTQDMLYSATQLGTIEAYELPEEPLADSPTSTPIEIDPIWSMDFDMVGIPLLLPLPGGEVVIFVWDEMAAVSPQGRLLWSQENVGRAFDWVHTENELLISSVEHEGFLMSVTAQSAEPWEIGTGGKLSADTDKIVLLNADGVYQLDPRSTSITQLVELPGRRIDLADIITLPDGSTLFTHLDNADRRLIQINSQDQIISQRSIAAEISGETSLTEVNGLPFLIENTTPSDALSVIIYAIDLSQGKLTRIFEGGTRAPISDIVELINLDGDQVAIIIGGQSITVLDLEEALIIAEQ